MENMNHSFAIK